MELQVCHLDLENGVIRIINSKNKKQRLVPVHDTIKKMLIDYCRARHDYDGEIVWPLPFKEVTEGFLQYEAVYFYTFADQGHF